MKKIFIHMPSPFISQDRIELLYVREAHHLRESWLIYIYKRCHFNLFILFIHHRILPQIHHSSIYSFRQCLLIGHCTWQDPRIICHQLFQKVMREIIFMKNMPGSLSASTRLYFHIGLLAFIKATRNNPTKVTTVSAGKW